MFFCASLFNFSVFVLCLHFSCSFFVSWRWCSSGCRGQRKRKLISPKMVPRRSGRVWLFILIFQLISFILWCFGYISNF